MRAADDSTSGKDINAVLLALYLWMFIILRIAWAFDPRYSTIVLGVLAFAILVRSILATGGRVRATTFRAVVMLGAIVVSILVDMVLRDNSVLGQRLYEFMIYGVVPVFLLSQVRDFGRFFRTYVTLSVIVFFVYVLDPFNDYYFSQTYMVYGFQAMLPAFFGLHIAGRQTGQRWYVVLEVIALAMMLLFGNRMAGIAGIVFLLVYEVAFGKSSRTRLLQYAALAGVGSLLAANIGAVIAAISGQLRTRGYSSYSLNATMVYLSGSLESLSAGRDVLWSSAMALIGDKPIVGYGLGYFESVQGIYVHNIALELLVAYGVIGLIAYGAVLLNGILQIARSDGALRLFGVLLFCTSFPKLLTSVHIFVEPTFWMLLFFGFFAPAYRRVCTRLNEQVVE